MLQKFLATGVAACVCAGAFAQDTTKNGTFTLSGNADVYYRYNLSNPKSGPYNSITSFTQRHNSFELGMATLKAEYTKGKAGVVADLGFGQRAEEFAYNDENTRFAIKQLYVTYAPSAAVKFTFGSWATHVGYEVLDPYLNRNYSMSYMFSFGPFSHTGIKADIALGGKSGLMLGIANPTDLRTASAAPKTFLAQFSTSSSNDKLKAYVNFAGGKQSDFAKAYQGDLVLTYAASSTFSLGFNGTYQTVKDRTLVTDDWSASKKWWGSALYLNIDPTDKFGLTLRTEYFSDKDGVKTAVGNVIVPTLSANFKVDDHLTIIPEFRFDSAKEEAFIKSDGTGTKSTGSFLLAATYHF
jgi:hypothetical protein